MKKYAAAPTASWVIVNGVFLSLIVLGFVYDTTWASVTIYIGVGVLALTSVFASSSPLKAEMFGSQIETMKQKGYVVGAPACLELGYDMSVLTILALSSAWPAALMYLLMCYGQNRLVGRIWNDFFQTDSPTS